MSKYKIFRYNGQYLMTIEADIVSVQSNGQTLFYNEPDLAPVAVFPDGVLIVKDDVIATKPREFDFVGQKEKIAKRNEHLTVETKKPAALSESLEAKDVKKDTPEYYMTEKRAEEVLRQGTFRGDPATPKQVVDAEEKLPNYRKEHQSKLLKAKLDELAKAHTMIIPNGNDKQLENAEARAIDQIETITVPASDSNGIMNIANEINEKKTLDSDEWDFE